MPRSALKLILNFIWVKRLKLTSSLLKHRLYVQRRERGDYSLGTFLRIIRLFCGSRVGVMQLKEELLENTSNKDCDDLVKGKMGMS